MVSMLGVSCTGHAVAAALLLVTAGPSRYEVRVPAIQITWLGCLPEPGSEPARVPVLDPEIALPEYADGTPLHAQPETLPAPDVTVCPEPVMPSARVEVVTVSVLESNYWFQVRAEMARHLRWPAGLPRSALVMVELTIDDQGGLVGVSTHPGPGDEVYARGVERAVRRAAPFPPPGPVCRTARLPVRFSNHNPTEK